MDTRMTKFLDAPRLGLLGVALLSCGLTLSACNGPASTSSPGVVPQSRGLTPLIGTAASPIPFTFQTVDDPTSSVNEVTGIDALSEIVGTVGSGAPSNPFGGYTSVPPYSSFQPVNFSRAQGTVATSVVSVAGLTLVVGYVINPQQLTRIWGFIDINNLFTLLKDRKEGTGNNAVTEILSTNASEFGAGFYTNSSGVNIPVEANLPLEKFYALKPPGATGAEATGINVVNDVSGWGSTAGGVVGFFLRAGRYYPVAYPGATLTEALGLNSQDQIVGYYQTSGGGVKHGFILTGPTKSGSQQVWQTIDEPNEENGTVVTGVNDSDDICGYYIDGSGIQHGFVAVP